MVPDRGRLNDKRFRSGLAFACIASAALSLCPTTALSQESATPAAADTLAPLAPPTNVQVADTQNDRGSQIDVSWDQSPDAEAGLVQYYRIYRSSHPDTGFAAVGRVGFAQSNYTDAGMPDNQPLYYRVAAAGYDDRLAYSGTVGPVMAHPQWFNWNRFNVMIAVIIFVVAIVYYVKSARGGKELFIRRLPGLDEIDNAVGRATEMGKPILYISGLSSVSDQHPG
jgi:hypothetical protein